MENWDIGLQLTGSLSIWVSIAIVATCAFIFMRLQHQYALLNGIHALLDEIRLDGIHALLDDIRSDVKESLLVVDDLSGEVQKNHDRMREHLRRAFQKE
jgi:hypothetical protein